MNRFIRVVIIVLILVPTTHKTLAMHRAVNALARQIKNYRACNAVKKALCEQKLEPNINYLKLIEQLSPEGCFRILNNQDRFFFDPLVSVNYPTLLHVIAQHHSADFVTLIKAMLNKLRPEQRLKLISAKNFNGDTALHVFAMWGLPEMITFLLKDFDDNQCFELLSEQNYTLNTPLHVAIMNLGKQEELVEKRVTALLSLRVIDRCLEIKNCYDKRACDINPELFNRCAQEINRSDPGNKKLSDSVFEYTGIARDLADITAQYSDRYIPIVER